MLKIWPRKTLHKRIRAGAKSARDSVEDSVEAAGDSVRAHPGRTAATVLGVVLAGAAGVGAALRFWRRDDGETTLHVMSDGAEGWTVERDGATEPLASFDSKKKAVHAARSAATAAAPCDLLIHRADGSVSRTHHYERS